MTTPVTTGPPPRADRCDAASVQMLIGAHRQATGLSPSAPAAEVLAVQGWTPQTYRCLSDLAHKAVASNAEIAFHPQSHEAGLRRAVRELAAWGGTLAQGDVSWPMAAPWLALLAVQQDRASANRVRSALNTLPRHLPPVARMLGSVAPLAWAAGLSWADAHRACWDGDLTTEWLRARAADRGLQVPD